MKKNPKPLIYLVLGIALLALANSTMMLQGATRTGLVIWGFIGIIGDILIFIVTPIHLYYWFKIKKTKQGQDSPVTSEK